MSYVFEPSTLHEITGKALGLPRQAMFDAVREGLEEAYPGHVHRGGDWQITAAGGAQGVVNLIHASVTEYLLFFGSPAPTSGHSGRHRCEVHQFILDGEVWCYDEGDLERRELKPGDATTLRPSTARGYCVNDRVWMLEYGRGPIPLMFPFALAGPMFVTLDARGLARSLLRYGSLTARSLLRGKI